MNELACQIRSEGAFRAVVHTGHQYDAHGNIVKHGIILRETPFNCNKITMDGFNHIMKGEASNLVMVAGAGNATPTELNTSLSSYLGKSQTFSASSTTRNTVPDVNNEVWWRMTKRCTFGPGSLGGGAVNVAEAGVTLAYGFSDTNSSTPVSAHGLLVNESMTPASVSVDNSTEYLDIIWQYTEYVKASTIGTVDLTLDGVTTPHNVEVRPYYFDNVGGSYNYHPWRSVGDSDMPNYSPIGDSTYTWTAASNVFAGPLVDITGNDLGNGTRGNVPIITSAPYVNNSKQRGLKLTWLPTTANNIAGGIGVVRVNLGHAGFQLSYAPKIQKVYTKQLDLDFLFSMANR